jgi:thioredoxin-related protein
MKRSLCSVIAVSCLLTLSCVTATWARSAAFSELSFAEAKQKAQEENKLLLVDFTASWCGPCKDMEADTWSDAGVQSWITQNAIAVQVDVDEDRKTSKAMKIDAMPTLVLFTPQSTSKEFGRQVGYMEPSELLRWLEGAKSGKSPEELKSEVPQDGGAGMWEHITKARELSTAGKSAEALEEYIWLWNNIPADHKDFKDIRASLLPFEMNKLCAADPAAKAKISQIRDAASNRKDWIILNGILNDHKKTLAWFDKVKNDPQERDVLEKCSSLLETVLFTNSRWADAATYMYANPLAKINQYYKQAQEMKKPRDAHTEVSQDFDPFPSMVFLLYGSYVGAGRDAEAQKIENACLQLDDTPAMRTGLSNMAQGMRQARAAAAQNKATK